MTKRIVYGVALFLVALMGLGLFINYLGMAIGNNRPLNSGVILFSFWFIVFVVTLVNKDKIIAWIKSWHKPSIPFSVYALILLPIMAIVGAELVNYYQNNSILLVLLVVVAIIPIICMFTKVIPEKYWAFTIFMIGLSLVLHRALISNYLWGSDNLAEYGVYRVTNLMGKWDSNLITGVSQGYNTTLSVTILPVMIAKITRISGFMVFKVVFPIIVTLIPVGMYEIFKKQFSSKISFLGCFLFMACYSFYTTLLNTDKQTVACFLMVVFVLMMLEENSRLRNVLLLTLGIGIVVSHYAVAILLLMLIIPIAIALYRKKAMPIYIPIVIVAFAVGWYALQGHGFVLKEVLDYGKNALTVPIDNGAVSNQVSAFPRNEVVRLLTYGSSDMPLSMLYIYFVMIGLTFVGALKILIERFKKVDWYLIAIVMLGIYLLAEVVLPSVSSIITVDRIFPLAMIFLAPLMFVALSWIFRKWAIVLSVVFSVVFLLCNTGFIYNLVHQPLANSISLDYRSNILDTFSAGEIQGAEWMVNRIRPSKIYYDSKTIQLFFYLDDAVNDTTNPSRVGYYLTRNPNMLEINNIIPAGSYIFLSKFNMEYKEFYVGYTGYEMLNIKFVRFDGEDALSKVIESSKVVFDNGDCRILQTTEDYVGQ